MFTWADNNFGCSFIAHYSKIRILKLLKKLHMQFINNVHIYKNINMQFVRFTNCTGNLCDDKLHNAIYKLHEFTNWIEHIH